MGREIEKKGHHLLGERKRECTTKNVNVTSIMQLPKMGSIATLQKRNNKESNILPEIFKYFRQIFIEI